MRPLRLLPLSLAVAVLTVSGGTARGGDPAPGPEAKPPPFEPPTTVEIPAEELDVLVKAQGKGVVLTYREYKALLDEVRAKEATSKAAPPEDAVRLSAAGTLDLTDERAARFEIVYRVEGLAPGPRSLGFESGGVAFESVKVEPEEGAGPARYEEREGGHGRLYLDGPGVRKVTVTGSAVPAKNGAERRLDLWLPNPAAMSLAVTLPPGVSATIAGEGPAVTMRSPPEAPLVVKARPTRGGNLVLSWAEAALGTEGKSVLDADVKTLWTVKGDVVAVRSLVRVDVLRTPAQALTLEVPADFSVHSVEGPGVTGSSRSEDRTHLTVALEKPTMGRVEILLQGERPFLPGKGVEMPRIAVPSAVRHRGEAALRFTPEVKGKAVSVEGGRRIEPVTTPPPPAGGPAPDPLAGGTLRYALARADATVRVDVEAAALKVDATSTYYLNLAEPGQTLIATVAYRVTEGTLFRLRPRFPKEFDLRELTVNGSPDGFTRDAMPDGGVEIALQRGVPTGGELSLLATLERAKADWVPEREHETVLFSVPSSGSSREEGYVAVGADAGFEVLDAGTTDLVSVGAADLTARGLSSAGLLYGYRLDGPAPAVTLDVVRRTPLVTADVVTVLHPGPRRVDLAARAIYRIQRAGVLRLFLDLPSSAGEQVDFQTADFRATTHLAGAVKPADVPAGYERWQVDLSRRAIGTHVVTARWFLDREGDDWTLPPSERVAAQVPVARAQRFLVVRRSAGLEVTLPEMRDVRSLDLAELPPEATLSPQSVLEVLRLPAGRDGVQVAVKKHAGAAVLDAIATEVSLSTAVAREGILRTRADLSLVNVDRQFVTAVLPEGSALIGAVVDGQPVKPLVDPKGALLVTVPSTLRGARGKDARAHVVLTWQTDLGGPVTGDVRVEEPRFPGLEILHTTHEVGLEENLRISSVAGDFLPTGRVEGPERKPWIVGFLAGYTLSASKEATESVARTRSTPSGGGGGSSDAGGAGGAAPGVRQFSEPMHPPAPPAATPPPPGAAATPVPPPAAAGQPMPDIKDAESADHGEGDEAPPEGPESQGEGKPGEGATPSGGTGIGKGEGFGARKPARGQKALLSLDVPVFLAPNRVVAARVGGGGAIEVRWVSSDASEARYLVLGAVALSIGLVVVAAGWLPGWLAVLAGLLVALVLRVSFGAAASTFVAAAADAATLLAGLLLLRRLANRIAFGRKRRKKPVRAPSAAAAAGPTAAVLLVAGLLLLAGGEARADDEPVPDSGPAEGTPAIPTGPAGSVFVPKGPAGGAGLRPEDRVFVPLETWRDMERRAHPERDPELVALGRIAALVSAEYEVHVGAKNVEGSARLVLSQRGKGTLLVSVPLSGLAVTDAKLDGEAVRLILDGGIYRVPLAKEGDHVLELKFQAPVLSGPAGRTFAFGAPTSVVASLTVTAPGFDGDLSVSGAGRVEMLSQGAGGTEARAWLGRPTGAGLVQTVVVTLAEKRPSSMPAAVRTRAESRTVHSVRDGGTESVVTAEVFVLQGKAPFVDLSIPEGVDVLEATGPQMTRWETSEGKVRLVLNAPQEGRVSVRVRAFRAAKAPEREETPPEIAVLGTTGESGVAIVNGDPSMRIEAAPGSGLLRTGRPAEPDALGPDGKGRVVGAWRFAARPAALSVRVTKGEPRVEAATVARATFGDDRVRTVLEAKVRVARAPVGDLSFALPGEDEVRSVVCAGLDRWWTEGTGDLRRLFVRTADLFEGERVVTARLERRLGGAKDALAVPRWSLAGAQADKGLLVLFALPDVEPFPGFVPGLRSLPPSRLEGQASDVPGARPTNAFEWDAPLASSLAVALRSPDPEIEAVVVTQVSPSDEEQRLEHLVVFDVRRGAAERLSIFVPDGGLSANDVVRARDLRELRSEKATRKDADGKDVDGLLYTVRLQSAKSGLVEVTVSQAWPAGASVRVVRPEGAKATRWFGLVSTFLDGEVDVRVSAGQPDVASWADVPFLPQGLERTAVLKAYASRAPYVLDLAARRHRLETQADAVVLAAHAEVVLGLDGDARVRVRYRLFNRARQFLALRLPEGAVLFGASAAGRPVKPLAGAGGIVLIPIPKVPLGGTGYEVAVAYRAKAGESLRGGGKATLPLPEVDGVEVDRTAITLRAPEGLAYDFDTKMTAAEEREVIGDEVEASLREAQEVLKVAETGTLEQRLTACENSAPLVADAERRLSAYRSLGMDGGRASALQEEVTRLTRVRTEAQTRCQTDQGIAQGFLEFSGDGVLNSNANGQTLVTLDGTETATAAAATREAGQATWRFNKEAAPEAADKKDLAELKGRMRESLARRDVEDMAKSADLDAEKRARADPAAKAPAPDEVPTDDSRRAVGANNFAVNERLRRVQLAGRQLGTAAAPQTATPPLPPGGAEDVGAAREATARSGDDLDRALPESAVTRAGLMGVDVPLPKDGRTFWFVGPRAGSPVLLDASPSGTPAWLRSLLCAGLLGVIGFGVFLVRRRLPHPAA